MLNTRYQFEAHADRNCPFCLNGIEDGHYFVFGCPAYHHIREKHVTHYFEDNGQPTLNIFLANPTIEVSRKCAMFVLYALKQREDVLSEWQVCIYALKCMITVDWPLKYPPPPPTVRFKHTLPI